MARMNDCLEKQLNSSVAFLGVYRGFSTRTKWSKPNWFQTAQVTLYVFRGAPDSTAQGADAYSVKSENKVIFLSPKIVSWVYCCIEMKFLRSFFMRQVLNRKVNGSPWLTLIGQTGGTRRSKTNFFCLTLTFPLIVRKSRVVIPNVVYPS